jgi:hypothetical protein
MSGVDPPVGRDKMFPTNGRVVMYRATETGIPTTRSGFVRQDMSLVGFADGVEDWVEVSDGSHGVEGL